MDDQLMLKQQLRGTEMLLMQDVGRPRQVLLQMAQNVGENLYRSGTIV